MIFQLLTKGSLPPTVVSNTDEKTISIWCAAKIAQKTGSETCNARLNYKKYLANLADNRLGCLGWQINQAIALLSAT